MPAHPTFYARRRVIETLGGFDTRYRIASDYDFMLRALELTDFRSTFVDRVLVHMMHGGESTAGLRSVVKHNYEALCSRRQWLDSGIVDYSLFAKPMRKLTQLQMPSFRAAWRGRNVKSGGGTKHAPLPGLLGRRADGVNPNDDR